MTKIDFHSNVADKLHYAYRLIRKAYAANCKMTVYHHDMHFLRQLDEALWTLGKAEFLPHVMIGDALAPATPIVLAPAKLEQSPQFDLLINLSTTTPEYFSSFGRMIEVVSAEPDDKLAGRERYRYYQQQGYTLSHHVAK